LRWLIALIGIVSVAAQAAAADRLSDPYDVLNEHYDAVGGFEKLRSEKTVHIEGTFEVAGLSGTIEYWGVSPDKSRMELDLAIIRQIEGDNGEISWTVDQNDKLQIVRDEAALKRREVEILKRAYEHRDPGSATFDVTLEGVEPVDGIECYVVRTSNAINDDYVIEYFNVESFVMEKSVSATSDQEMHTRYSDYREVEGILRSFHQEMEMLPIPQSQTLHITEYDVGIEIDPALFDPPEQDVRDFAFVDGGTGVDVPFQFIERHLFVPVTIDCRESLWVVDTGASMTCIDKGYAEDLGLEAHGDVKGAGANNAVDVSFATLPPFTVPGIRFEEQTAAVLEISELFRRTGGLEIGGILGYDFLSRFVTRVDYANEMFSFYDPATFEYEGDGVTLDAPLRGGTFTVPVVVDGEHGGTWSVDLGAGGTAFHYPYAREHGLLDRDALDAVGFGAGGRVDRRYSQFDEIEFAGFTIDDPRISLPIDEPVGAFGSSEITGNLGNTLFRHFVLTLDYERQQVIVEKGDNFGHDFPVDRTGLQLWLGEGDVIEVLAASPGTPADEAGFEVGDVIGTVNGIAVERFDGIRALRELGREEPGTSYRIGIVRDGAEKEITLTLDELF